MKSETLRSAEVSASRMSFTAIRSAVKIGQIATVLILGLIRTPTFDHHPARHRAGLPRLSRGLIASRAGIS